MKKIYISAPYKDDVKKDMENTKKYCRYIQWDGIPFAPHMYFAQFMDASYSTDRWKAMRMSLEILKTCDKVCVFADEITEEMIQEITEAKKHNIPIEFRNADMEEIKYESLIINKRIGPGYRQIIEDTFNPGGNRICPYASTCEKAEKPETECKMPQVISERKESVKQNGKSSRKKIKEFLQHLFK